MQNDVTEIHDKTVIADENNLRKTSNDHYMNIIEKSYEVKLKCKTSEISIRDNNEAMQCIIARY